MKKNILAAVLAISLTACGGSSSDSTPPELTTGPFSEALKLCGSGTAQPIYEGALVFDDNQRYKLEPKEPEATVEVQDSGSVVCITGGLAGVGFTGTGHAAYVNGDVSEVIIPGSGNTLVVWGEVTAMTISGDNNSIYSAGVATYDDQGEGNTVQDVDMFNFPQ